MFPEMSIAATTKKQKSGSNESPTRGKGYENNVLPAIGASERSIADVIEVVNTTAEKCDLPLHGER